MENTKEIGGRVFTFGQLPATEAIRVEVAIARVIGEPLFKAFVDRKKPEEGAEEDAAAAGAAAIGLLTAKMNADELLDTMGTVFKYVSVDGKRVQIDATFAGRPKEVWQVFAAALAYNFADFFAGGLFGSIRDKMQAAASR